MAFVTALLVGFVVGTPYSLLDYRAFVTDVVFDMTHLSGGHGVDLGRGWVYHLTTTLPYGLGIPVFLAAVAGIIPMVRSYPRHACVLGLFAAAFYGSIGSGQTVFFRYVLPLLPVLCVPAAVATDRAAGWLAARTRLSSHAALVLLAVLLSGPGLVNCVWFDILLSRTDSRVLAARWMAPRLRAGDSLYDSGSEYTRLNLSKLPHHQWWFDAPSESFRHPGGETPDWMILYESALSSYTRTHPAILELAKTRYRLVQTIPATAPRPGAAVYDLQDAFFMPVSRFDEVRRPGPTVRIYVRRDATSLFGNDDSRQPQP